MLNGLLEQTVRTISTAETTAPADGRPRLFFPNGIELIDLHVKLAAVDIEVKVAGPKPSVESAVRKPVYDATPFSGGNE